MLNTYTKSLSTDFGGSLNKGQLHREIISDGEISPFLIQIMISGDVITFLFLTALSTGEETALDTIISNHIPTTNYNTTLIKQIDGQNENLFEIKTSTNANRFIVDKDGELVKIGSATPTTNDNLKWDGNKWVPVAGGSGDVSGPGSAIDQGLVRFNGTGGKTLESVGVRHYGSSVTDPVSPTPTDGDKYYNTAINHEMCYDGSRSKWLSVAILMDGAGCNGNTSGNTYYKRWNGMLLSATQGPYVAKGTIIRIGYSTSAAVTHTYEVLVDGSVVASLASGGAASAYSESIDGDFNAGILTSRNASGSDTTNNFQSTIYYKLRV